jgi:hypothetical protein
MKLLISEENIGKVPPAPVNPRGNPYLRYGGRDRPREFDDQTISQLTSLGFPRRLATESLQRTHGNVEMAIEYLLTLPPDRVEEVKNEEAKTQSIGDPIMEIVEERNEDEEEGMDVDTDPDIMIKNADDLAKAIKNWLKMLFNWILKGFNSTLTDIDVENITQFILKYISTEEDVQVLMDTLIQAFEEMNKFLLEDDGRDFSDVNYQKERKSCLKKASTISKILSNLSKYFVTNLPFMESLMECIKELFEKAGTNPLKFVPGDKEVRLNENMEVETPK